MHNKQTLVVYSSESKPYVCVYIHLSNVSFFLRYFVFVVLYRFFFFLYIYIYVYMLCMLFIPPTCLPLNAVTLFRGFRMNTFKAFHHGFCFFVNSRSTYNAYANVQFPGVRVLFLAKSFWNKLVKNSHATVQYTVSKLFFPIYIVDLQKANLFMLKLKSKYDLLQRVFCQRSSPGVKKRKNNNVRNRFQTNIDGFVPRRS